MSDSAETFLSHKDVLRAILKQQGIKEGLWQLTVRFGFNAGNIGPDAKNVSPGAFAVVDAIGFKKVTEGPDSLTVNAAEVSQ